jgi:ribonucleotide monophosphatase NagD (HAD superfamily)
MSKQTPVFKAKTVFCDIDGTIFRYRSFATYTTSVPELLPGAKETVNGWYDSGHVIILTTARPEYLRHHTMKELSEAGIRYHQLVTSCGRAERYLINDKHPEDGDRAISFNLRTDQGFSDTDWSLINE